VVKLLVSGDSQIGPKLIKMDQNENSSSKYSTFLLKWVNTEWKQVAADQHELQSIPNFLSPRHRYGFRSLVCFFYFTA